VIRTLWQRLYTHAWTDLHSVLLGYGDGSLRLFDIRQPDQCVITFHDPLVQQIGSIALDPQRKLMVTFGNPEFSVWHCTSAPNKHFTLWHHDPRSVSRLQLELDIFYKNDGAFMLTGGRKNGAFLSTDAHGFLRLYDAHTAEQVALQPPTLQPPTYTHLQLSLHYPRLPSYLSCTSAHSTCTTKTFDACHSFESITWISDVRNSDRVVAQAAVSLASAP